MLGCEINMRLNVLYYLENITDLDTCEFARTKGPDVYGQYILTSCVV